MARQPGWISRNDRDRVSLDGSVRLADGREVAVSVVDLSRDGCRIESEETLTIGEEIVVSAPAVGTVAGTVRWSLFGTAGVRFLHAD